VVADDTHGEVTLAGRLDLLFQLFTKDDGNEYSLREVADAINASGGTISHAQIGLLRSGAKDNPNLKHLRSLADFFGVPVGYLAGDPGTENHLERAAATHNLRRIQARLGEEIEPVARLARQFLAAAEALGPDGLPFIPTDEPSDPSGPSRLEGIDTADLTVADEFYLITHDSRTGKPRLHQQALQVGLAAGLLAELLLAQALHVDVDRRRLELGPPDRVPSEPLAQEVFGLLKQEQHELRIWLEFFAQTSTENVALRLEREGLLRPKVSRRMFKDFTTWIPTNPSAGSESRARLGYRLRQAQGPTDLEPLDYALVGLIAATDFEEVLLAGASARTRHTFELVCNSIWPEPRWLFDEARALIGSNIITRRV
jgi:transcriptional regulator with XRE-family HTH domain